MIQKLISTKNYVINSKCEFPKKNIIYEYSLIAQKIVPLIIVDIISNFFGLKNNENINAEKKRKQ